MRFTKNVDTSNLAPVMFRALVVAEDAYITAGFEMTVTSLFDGKHSKRSLHYRDGICRAADLRTGHHWAQHYLTAQQAADMRDTISAALGPDFDVVLERDHIHLEYDPKTH